jgi:hypothetical protein
MLPLPRDSTESIAGQVYRRRKREANMQKTMSAMIEQQEWPAYTGGVEQAGRETFGTFGTLRLEVLPIEYPRTLEA